MSGAVCERSSLEPRSATWRRGDTTVRLEVIWDGYATFVLAHLAWDDRLAPLTTDDLVTSWHPERETSLYDDLVALCATAGHRAYIGSEGGLVVITRDNACREFRSDADGYFPADDLCLYLTDTFGTPDIYVAPAGDVAAPHAR